MRQHCSAIVFVLNGVRVERGAQFVMPLQALRDVQSSVEPEIFGIQRVSNSIFKTDTSLGSEGFRSTESIEKSNENVVEHGHGRSQ